MNGLWPKNFGSPSKIVEDIIDLSNSWSERLSNRPQLLTAVQHGDLNPGNIIVRSAGSPVLIDLSRLGHWPIGYDLSRLSLMLRLRLVDARDYRDWMPDKLEEWVSERAAALGTDPGGEFICAESLYCDEQFQYFLQSTAKKYRDRLALGYKLGCLWDLLKVISYQDTSPYKRLWALLEAWRIGTHLKLIG